MWTTLYVYIYIYIYQCLSQRQRLSLSLQISCSNMYVHTRNNRGRTHHLPSFPRAGPPAGPAELYLRSRLGHRLDDAVSCQVSLLLRDATSRADEILVKKNRYWLGKYWFPSQPPWQILCTHDISTLELPKWSNRPFYHFLWNIFYSRNSVFF